MTLRHNISIPTQNAVLFGQYMSNSEMYSFREALGTLALCHWYGVDLYTKQPLGQTVSLSSSSVNRKGRGAGSVRVAVYTCYAKGVRRKRR